MSIIAWVFARSGIDYYNVDPAIGMKDSLRVRGPLEEEEKKCLRTWVLTFMIQLVFLGSVLVQLPLTAVKIAILLFYKRIFATRTFAIWVWVAITIVSLWGAIFFFVRHPSSHFDLSRPSQKSHSFEPACSSFFSKSCPSTLRS